MLKLVFSAFRAAPFVATLCLLAILCGYPLPGASAEAVKPNDRSSADDITVELRRYGYRDFFDSTLSLSGTPLAPMDAEPTVKNLPEIRGRKTWYQGQLGDYKFLCLLESFEPEGTAWFAPPRLPILHVDMDGDGDFTGARRLEARLARSSFYQEFGVVTFKKPGRRDDADEMGIMFRRSHQNYLTLLPTTYYRGYITRGRSRHLVVLVDSSLDGRLDDFYDSSSKYNNADTLAIDLNGDRQLAYEHFVFVEVQPLTKMAYIQGKYYGIEVDPEGSTLRLAPVEPTFGTLDIGHPDAQLIVLSDAGVHHLAGSEGNWKLPVGRYRTLSMALQRKDKRDKWRLEASIYDLGKMSEFDILADKSTAIRMGPPLTVSTDVKKLTIERGNQRGTYASIGLTIRDQAGAEYTTGVLRNEKRAPAPKLKITDADGKALHTGQFEYG